MPARLIAMILLNSLIAAHGQMEPWSFGSDVEEGTHTFGSVEQSVNLTCVMTNDVTSSEDVSTLRDVLLPLSSGIRKDYHHMSALYPAVFLTHGGGPMPLLGDPGHRVLVSQWKELAERVVAKSGPPKAIVVISAHYETTVASVGGSAAPKMLYDYGGFPREAYSLQYPAPGDTVLATRIHAALEGANIRAKIDAERPYDHGVFVPLMMMFPDASIPIVPLSVLKSQDPSEHIAMGLALRKFREEGVLFLGSGASMHNFKNLFDTSRIKVGQRFNRAMTAVLSDTRLTAEERLAKMCAVKTFDGVEESQPPGGFEHLMPLLTTVGVSGGSLPDAVLECDLMASEVVQYLFEH